jgi:hypothetical protein
MLRLLGIPPAARVVLGLVLLGVGIAVHRVPLMLVGGVATLISLVSVVGSRDRDETGRR